MLACLEVLCCVLCCHLKISVLLNPLCVWLLFQNATSQFCFRMFLYIYIFFFFSKRSLLVGSVRGVESSLSMSLSMSVWLSVCLCLSLSLSVSLCLCLSVSVSLCLSVCLSVSFAKQRKYLFHLHSETHFSTESRLFDSTSYSHSEHFST